MSARNTEQAVNEQIGVRVYTTQDIQKILSVSRSTAYTFIRKTYEAQDPFPVLRIGNSYRIEKTVFDAWLKGGA